MKLNGVSSPKILNFNQYDIHPHHTEPDNLLANMEITDIILLISLIVYAPVLFLLEKVLALFSLNDCIFR